jgi:predicted HTH transcriptional regulator
VKSANRCFRIEKIGGNRIAALVNCIEDAEFVENNAEFVEKFVENSTQELIIKLMIERPSISVKAISEKIGMTSRGVQKNIDNLKKLGLVERVGSAKGGYWLVKEPEKD